MGELLMRVFTHPACSGCSAAVRRAWELNQAQPEIELRTVSSVEKAGLAEAQREGIKTIPTIIFSSPAGEQRRFVGTPQAGALASFASTLSSPV